MNNNVHIITLVVDESKPGWCQALRNLQRGALTDCIVKVDSHVITPVDQIRSLIV